MSTVDLNTSNINSELLKTYQQNLLSHVLSEGIRRNEDQFKVWSAYKKGYTKVIEALEKLPLELSVNCMVPIGKRALMKGKLIHTNEILASLGDGYFTKYSASKAIAFCNRRIQFAEEMLQTLEKERNLFEMRQVIPLELDAFGTEERTDLIEHWDEQKLDDWRAKHREREKEYHKKLSEIRKMEKTEINTEEDLFRRLDELELEEELADEINRLEDERSRFYGDKLQEGEVYYESSEEEDTSSDEPTSEMIERELEKLREIRKSKTTENTPTPSVVESDKTSKGHQTENNTSKTDTTKVLPKKAEDTLSETIMKHETINFNRSKSMNDVTNVKEKVKREKRVSFAEPSDDKLKSNKEIGSSKVQSKEEITRVKNEEDKENEDEDEDDDIIRIEFKHTDNNPSIQESSDDKIRTPKDIYKLIHKPKSILKRTSNDTVPHRVTPLVIESDTDEEEEEDESIKPSAYTFVVKDIQEKERPTSMEKQTEVPQEKRPVSKFRMERSKK